MTIKEIRQKTVLKHVEFSKKYGIPRRSIENWETGKRKCPNYVVNMLNTIVELGLDIVKEDNKKENF